MSPANSIESSKKNKRPTAKQIEILKVIDEFIYKYRLSPTFSEVAKIMGYKSQNSAVEHILNLEKKGLVTKRNGLSRSLAITHKGLEVLNSDLDKKMKAPTLEELKELWDLMRELELCPNGASSNLATSLRLVRGSGKATKPYA